MTRWPKDCQCKPEATLCLGGFYANFSASIPKALTKGLQSSEVLLVLYILVNILQESSFVGLSHKTVSVWLVSHSPRAEWWKMAALAPKSSDEISGKRQFPTTLNQWLMTFWKFNTDGASLDASSVKIFTRTGISRMHCLQTFSCPPSTLANFCFSEMSSKNQRKNTPSHPTDQLLCCCVYTEHSSLLKQGETRWRL